MEATRTLRWYAVLAVLFFGIVPAAMVTALVIRGDTPGAVGTLLIGGIPLVLAAIFVLVRGFTADDPQDAVNRFYLSMALIAGADVLLLGGNALIRMTSS